MNTSYPTPDPDTLPVFAIHYRALNDANGNPRRIFVGFNEYGMIVEVEDEGYAGRPKFIRDMNALGRYEYTEQVSVKRYNELRKIERDRAEWVERAARHARKGI